MVLLERNLYGHVLAGLLWERQFEKGLLGLEREEVPNWKCLFVHRKQRLFLSVYVDDIKDAWKEAEYGSHVEETDEKCVQRRYPQRAIRLCRVAKRHDLFQESLLTDEGIDGVVSSTMKIKVVAPIRYVLEDQSCFHSQMSFYHSCTMIVSLQFEGAQFLTVSFPSS